MNYWDSVGRWINTLLVFIVGILAFDTLFRMLRANDDNVIVGFVRVLALAFLVPFQGMFGDQDYVLTTLFAVLGYSLLAGIALGVLRSLQASRAQQPPHVPHELPAETAQSQQQAPGQSQAPAPRRADGERRRGARPTARPSSTDESRRTGRRQSRAAGVGDDDDTRRPRAGTRDRASGQRPASQVDPGRSS